MDRKLSKIETLTLAKNFIMALTNTVCDMRGDEKPYGFVFIVFLLYDSYVFVPFIFLTFLYSFTYSKVAFIHGLSKYLSNLKLSVVYCLVNLVSV